jgi:hypothetical protein
MKYETTPFAQPSSEKQSEEYLQGLIAKYPTPDSMAEDVRTGEVSQLAIDRRFTDPEDRARVRALIEDLDAQEAAAATEHTKMLKETYVTPLLKALDALPEEVKALVFGEEEHAYEEQMEILELAPEARDEERLKSLNEKSAELLDAVAKDDAVAIHALAGELKALL